MEQTKTDYFFDLSNFEHKSIFDNCRYVWEVLSKIPSYLLKYELGNIEGDVDNCAYLINPEKISIGKGSVVEPGAYIKGPCIIGKNCTVRHGAYLRGNIIAGNNCVLGHDSEFKNAMLLNNANASHFAYVGDTILGNHVNLGAGTICANLKLNKGLVSIRIDSEKIETNLRKFGAIMGDFSQTGCNSVLNPGTLLGKNTMCYPCSNLGGLIPSKHVVKAKK